METLKKSDLTRKKILDSARKVFSEHPYNAASMRMIGKEGNFEHTIIRYHFSSKAELFETIFAEIYEVLYREHALWLEGLENMNYREGLTIFIDRITTFHFKNPEPLRIIMQNIAQSGEHDTIPGYQYIPKLLASTQKNFEEKIQLTAPNKNVSMFLFGFNAIITNFLGASSCYSQVMRMDPEGEEYLKWVKDTLYFVLEPLLKMLIFAQQNSSDTHYPSEQIVPPSMLRR